MNTTHIDSILIPAEYPARASVPKLLTTDCTSIMPIDTVDCCSMDGMAILTIPLSSAKLNMLALSPDSFLIARISTMKESSADIPCAISVAHAAPATPQPNEITKMRSSTTFMAEENMRNSSGMRERPSALNMEESTLYMKRNGNPMK